MMSHLIKIYAVCKLSYFHLWLLGSEIAVKLQLVMFLRLVADVTIVCVNKTPCKISLLNVCPFIEQLYNHMYFYIRNWF